MRARVTTGCHSRAAGVLLGTRMLLVFGGVLVNVNVVSNYPAFPF